MANAAGTSVQDQVTPFEFNNVFRDGIQSNLGTNTSADEMLEMFLHTAEAAYAEVQAGGGTFMDLFMKKGRDAWGENDKLFGAYQEIITSALLRGDCVLGYDRNPQDVIDVVIEEFAKRGLNVVTNFHGMNYAPMQEGVFKAVHKAREKGYDITAPKVVCIEDNPNITVENCIEALHQQADMGADAGIYFKNASGKVDPDFVYELTKRVAEEFPGEKITVHTHNNHGLGEAIYLRAAEAAAEVNAPMAFDLSSHPMANGTGQPSARRFQEFLENHPSEKVRARKAAYNEDGERADFEKQYETRHRYGDSEVRYWKKSWDACYKSGDAGGSMSALKGMGILKDVKTQYRLADEDEALVIVAEIKIKEKALLGYPTSVTPYQKMMDQLAGCEAVWRKMPNESISKAPPYKNTISINADGDTAGSYVPFSRLTPAAVNYLSGGLGSVPALAHPSFIETAMKEKGFTEIPEFVPADQLPQKMEETAKRLEEAGYKEPSQDDVALAAMYGDEGFHYVMIKSGQSILPEHMSPEIAEKIRELNTMQSDTEIDVSEEIRVLAANGRKSLSPQQPPEWPEYLQKPSENHKFDPDSRVVHIYDVAMAVGGAAELERFAQSVTELEKHADGFYKTGIGPSGFFQRSKAQQGLKADFATNDNDIRAGAEYLTQMQEHFKTQDATVVQEFMDSVPAKLREYGMSVTQAVTAVNKHLPEILTEVVDRKAKGASARSLPQVKYGSVTKAYKGYKAPAGAEADETFNGASSGVSPFANKAPWKETGPSVLKPAVTK